MIVADVHKRFKQLWRKDAVLSTGTDEHGMKVFQLLIQLTYQVQKAALAKGEDPLQFCTTAAEKFKVAPTIVSLTCRIWPRR